MCIKFGSSLGGENSICGTDLIVRSILYTTYQGILIEALHFEFTDHPRDLSVLFVGRETGMIDE